MSRYQLVFCDKFLSDGICNDSNCTSIHHYKNYIPKKCSCNDVYCSKKHVNETYFQWYAKNLSQYANRINKHHLLCKFVNDCNNRTCPFAHNPRELITLYCDMDCRNDNCEYRHRNETREEYFDKKIRIFNNKKKLKEIERKKIIEKRKRINDDIICINCPDSKKRMLMKLLQEYDAQVL
jgi:hypothetical protein